MLQPSPPGYEPEKLPIGCRPYWEPARLRCRLSVGVPGVAPLRYQLGPQLGGRPQSGLRA